MERETTIATPGLITDPGPFSAPQGALYEAENVVIPRPGNIQPRGRFTWFQDLTAGGSVPLHITQWQGAVFTFYNNASYPVRNNLASSLTGPTSLTAGKTWSAQARDRLLFTSDQGVYSVDSTSATTCRRAGLPRPYAPEFTTGAGTGWLSNGNQTAYRVVYVRYVNGVPLFSPPSGYSTCLNSTGGAIAPQVTVWLSSELVAGDLVQIYRSPLQTTSPALSSDEMRLRITYTLTSTDITNGYIQPTDLLGDGTWSGPSLYTNESEEGILNANYRPEYAADLAYYNGMMFYAGVKSRQRLILAVSSVAVSSAEPNSTLGGRVFNGATTLGSPTITGVAAADIAYLAVGQYITLSASSGGAPENADADFPANTTVVSWNSGAGTITVSANALRTAGAHSMQVWDWVQVADGTNTRKMFANVSSTRASNCANFFVGKNPAEPETTWTNNYLLAGDPTPSLVALYVDGDSAYGQTWTFEALSYPGVAFTVKSTKPYAFSRYVDRTTGITSMQEGADNRLSYSKSQVPEAVPLLNFDDIGSSVNVIHRIMKLRDSLFIFTAEGLYRATGTSPETLSIEQFDPTCQLWDRRLLATSHDQIWAFTQNGPASITDGGVRSISDQVRRLFDQMWDLASGASSANLLQPWACADQAHDFVIFGARRTAGSVGTAFQWRGYVYNINTGAWTTWSSERTNRVIYCASSNASLFGTYLGAAAYSFTEMSPVVGDSVFNVSATVASVAGTTVTINGGSGWTPTVGDSFNESGDLFTVVSVASATQFTTDRATGYVPGATIIPIEGVESRVKWQAKAFGDPSLMKRYANAWLTFERFYRGYDATITWESYNNTTYLGSGNEKTDAFTIASLTELSSYTPASAEIPLEIMRDVPSEIAEDWAIRFGFKIKRASNFWTLAAMSMSFDHLSDRVGHR